MKNLFLRTLLFMLLALGGWVGLPHRMRLILKSSSRLPAKFRFLRTGNFWWMGLWWPRLARSILLTWKQAYCHGNGHHAEQDGEEGDDGDSRGNGRGG